MRGEPDFPASEATLYERDLYVEITLAWYQRQPHGLQIDRAFRPYVLGRWFASSVRDSLPQVDPQHVVAICALLVCSQPWRLDGLQKVLDTRGIGRAPKDELDPVCAWWYPLDKPSILGVHYWELGSGTLELCRLSRFDTPPALQFGRFATERIAHDAMGVRRRPRQCA
jgi:hypothetical protein